MHRPGDQDLCPPGIVPVLRSESYEVGGCGNMALILPSHLSCNFKAGLIKEEQLKLGAILK